MHFFSSGIFLGSPSPFYCAIFFFFFSFLLSFVSLLSIFFVSAFLCCFCFSAFRFCVLLFFFSLHFCFSVFLLLRFFVCFSVFWFLCFLPSILFFVTVFVQCLICSVFVFCLCTCFRVVLLDYRCSYNYMKNSTNNKSSKYKRNDRSNKCNKTTEEKTTTAK